MALAGHELSPRTQSALAVASTALTLTVHAPPGRASQLFPFAGDYTPIYIAPGDLQAVGPVTDCLLVKQSSNVHVVGSMIRLSDHVSYHGAFFQASNGALVRKPGALGQAHVVRVALPYNPNAPARVTMVRPHPNGNLQDVQTLVVPRASWNGKTFTTFVGNVTVGLRHSM